MKLPKYLLSAMICASLMSGAALAQTTTTTTTTPDAASTTVDTNVDAPARTTPDAPANQVEIHNQAPAAPANPPKVDIKMPDINVQQPANPTTTKETVTEHTTNTYVHDTTDNNDLDATQRANNTWMMVLFGVLAVLLIGAVVVGLGRRTTVIDDV